MKSDIALIVQFAQPRYFNRAADGKLSVMDKSKSEGILKSEMDRD